MKTKSNPGAETPDLKLLPNTMANDLIRTLVENYRSNQLMSVKEKLGIEDAHSIHFDLTTLKKFISDIEALSITNNPDIHAEDLGIRFYYAAYPKAENWDLMVHTPVQKEYAGRHTLVMVPTIKRKDDNGEIGNYDFNPLAINGNLGKRAMALGKNSDMESEIICQNHGALIPPDTKKTEFF
ncbi:hypothetical protein [Chryseobacterium taichungense]|uniref:hypothetical protein n=1 Tax=Chryseobacterium taichungense TaxID=295069 RepID=UPI0028A9EBF1|nr:hypothetical protein [Chryseobacterium taichungense]